METAKNQDLDFNDEVFVPLRLLGLTIPALKKLNRDLKRYANIRDILRLFLLREIFHSIIKQKAPADNSQLIKINRLADHYHITLTNDIRFIGSSLDFMEIVLAKNLDTLVFFKEICLQAKEKGFSLCELEKNLSLLVREDIKRYGLDRISDWQAFAEEFNISLKYIESIQGIQSLDNLNCIEEPSEDSNEKAVISNIIPLYRQ